MNVLFKCGLMPSPFQAGQTLEVNLVGQVHIELESFSSLQDRRRLIQQLSKGVYDWGHMDEEAEEEEDLLTTLNHDDA